MASPTDRPGLDQRDLPFPHREVSHCPRCGRQGVMNKFALDGLNVVQVQVVHEWALPCEECGMNHPRSVCVLATWPPTRWMNTQIRLHHPGGYLPPDPE